jgi:hypothetical protein
VHVDQRFEPFGGHVLEGRVADVPRVVDHDVRVLSVDVTQSPRRLGYVITS